MLSAADSTMLNASETSTERCATLLGLKSPPSCASEFSVGYIEPPSLVRLGRNRSLQEILCSRRMISASHRS